MSTPAQPAAPTPECPACGPGHCTPSCPEREWRYEQPAAPTQYAPLQPYPMPEHSGCTLTRPAASEPSAECFSWSIHGMRADDHGTWVRLDRAESAEAQLTAVKARVVAALTVLESGLQSRNYRAFSARVLEALTPAPSPGAGDGTER